MSAQKTVFVSYRQTSDAERSRVRTFAERLRECGINVVLDQFLLDATPGGPPEGWDKWSSDRALTTDYVIIIGSEAWFQCFEKKQKPGTGLGAACEADDLRHRIYKANGVIVNIRVVLFDDADSVHISPKIERYHRFHAERDFANIVKWLGGTPPGSTVASAGKVKTSIPHNLPALQPFFGREDELRKIADALDPESRTWGALIDGPGGMGKTSLAVRAAYDASPDIFKRIVFISLKSRELDDDGLRDLSGFLISGLAELFGELARELGRDDIVKATEDQRPRLLLDALRGTQTLLILDNLESLLKRERDILFTFVKKLPADCKAILTSRGRIGSGAEELILEKLSEDAALATLAELATHNPALAKTSEAERLTLYRETGGKPLLLRWTAGQIGRGHCVTPADAVAYLRSCPAGNDPLEFIFGDLVADFNLPEMRALCALTYFTLPSKVEHIAAVAGAVTGWPPLRQRAQTARKTTTKSANVVGPNQPILTPADIEIALKSLINRSLVVPSEELQTFTIVPLVADYLRKARPDVLHETGDKLERHAYALVVENGYRAHEHFPALDVAWPTMAAALPRFLAGENERLQIVCSALTSFLEFTGRWDEWLALSRDAESRAVAAGDFNNAGWRAYEAGWIHRLRGQSLEIIVCADRAATHWEEAKAGAREQAAAIQLRGHGYLPNDNSAAIAAYRQAVELWRTLGRESSDIASGLNALANAEKDSGDLEGAERDYSEALRIARTVKDSEGVAIYTSNLAELALARSDWTSAERFAQTALPLSEKIGRKELIAEDCRRLGKALARQGKIADALPYARRSVAIYQKLGSPNLEAAQQTLAECSGQL